MSPADVLLGSRTIFFAAHTDCKGSVTTGCVENGKIAPDAAADTMAASFLALFVLLMCILLAGLLLLAKTPECF